MRILAFLLMIASTSSAYFVRRVNLGHELLNVYQNLIPSLHQKYKGQNGRILVFGGSREYTGAPYYAGQSALKYGADLVSILCSKEAAGPIKSYSPELMVAPLYDDDKVRSHEKAIEVIYYRLYSFSYLIFDIPTICVLIWDYSCFVLMEGGVG